MKKLCVIILALASAAFGSFAETNGTDGSVSPWIHLGGGEPAVTDQGEPDGPNEQIIGEIFFNLDTDEFANPEFASGQLDAWAGLLKLLMVKKIHITGYAFDNGSPPPAEEVAQNRADKVIGILQKRLSDTPLDVVFDTAAQTAELSSVSDEQKRSLYRRASISVQFAEIIPPPPGPSPADDLESRAALAQAYYALAGLKRQIVKTSAKMDNAAALEVKELLDKVIALDSVLVVEAHADRIAVCISLEEYGQAIESIKALKKIDSDQAKKEAQKGFESYATAKGFKKIDGGTFKMGNPAYEPPDNDTERPQHLVTVSPFWINKYEVTQAEYEAVMGEKNNPSRYTSSKKLPVENVSWINAVEFCNKLSKQEGLIAAYTISGSGNSLTVACDSDANGYRLPTEAEWEFACRANTETDFNTGTAITTEQANYNELVPYNGTGFYRSHPVPVETFRYNQFYLYNMHGNVAEWCWDWYGKYEKSEAAQIDPIGPDSGTERVIRGGSFESARHEIRSASRAKNIPSFQDRTIGFRLVLPYVF